MEAMDANQEKEEVGQKVEGKGRWTLAEMAGTRWDEVRGIVPPRCMEAEEVKQVMSAMGLNVEDGEELVASKYVDARRKTYATVDSRGWISVFMRSKAVDGANGHECTGGVEGREEVVRVIGESAERKALSADRTRETIRGLVQLEAHHADRGGIALLGVGDGSRANGVSRRDGGRGVDGEEAHGGEEDSEEEGARGVREVGQEERCRQGEEEVVHGGGEEQDRRVEGVRTGWAVNMGAQLGKRLTVLVGALHGECGIDVAELMALYEFLRKAVELDDAMKLRKGVLVYLMDSMGQGDVVEKAWRVGDADTLQRICGNPALVEAILEERRKLQERGRLVVVGRIAAHAGDSANYIADAGAKAAARMRPVEPKLPRPYEVFYDEAKLRWGRGEWGRDTEEWSVLVEAVGKKTKLIQERIEVA